MLLITLKTATFQQAPGVMLAHSHGHFATSSAKIVSPGLYSLLGSVKMSAVKRCLLLSSVVVLVVVFSAFAMRFLMSCTIRDVSFMCL